MTPPRSTPPHSRPLQLCAPTVHTGGHASPTAMGRHQWTKRHMVLRRLLAKWFPRGRAEQRAPGCREPVCGSPNGGVSASCTRARCATPAIYPNDMPSPTRCSCRLSNSALRTSSARLPLWSYETLGARTLFAGRDFLGAEDIPLADAVRQQNP